MKKTYLLFFTMLAFSCHIDDEPELQEQEDQLIIVSASDEAKDLSMDGWARVIPM